MVSQEASSTEQRSWTFRILLRTVYSLALFLVYDTVLFLLIPSNRLMGWQEVLLQIDDGFLAGIFLPIAWVFLRATAVTMTLALPVAILAHGGLQSKTPVGTRDLALIIGISLACGAMFATVLAFWVRSRDAGPSFF